MTKFEFDVERMGEVSDGYHTFDELYYHRMMLFSIICKSFNNKAWKAKKHSDGTMYEDMFIVGIETPEGQYTYHYEDKHWDSFEIKELEYAPEYDGHQPKDITRLLSLFKEEEEEDCDAEYLICHSNTGLKNDLTIGKKYKIIHSNDGSCFFIINDSDWRHSFTKEEDTNGESYKDWFNEVDND